MTIGERIKAIRKEKNLTQTAFAERVKVSFGSISKLERGETNPSAQTIDLICREFNVSEAWLRDGIGDMNESEPANEDEDLIERTAGKYGLTAEETEILRIYLEIGSNGRTLIKKHVLRLLREALENESPESVPLTEDEIAERVAAYESLLKGIQQIEQLPDASTGTLKPASASSGAAIA